MLLELVVYGVGYHHAGLSINDRKTIEAMFTSGELPVLCKYGNDLILSFISSTVATSTLAMGVSETR